MIIFSAFCWIFENQPTAANKDVEQPRAIYQSLKFQSNIFKKIMNLVIYCMKML